LVCLLIGAGQKANETLRTTNCN